MSDYNLTHFNIKTRNQLEGLVYLLTYNADIVGFPSSAFMAMNPFPDETPFSSGSSFPSGDYHQVTSLV